MVPCSVTFRCASLRSNATPGQRRASRPLTPSKALISLNSGVCRLFAVLLQRKAFVFSTLQPLAQKTHGSTLSLFVFNRLRTLFTLALLQFSRNPFNISRLRTLAQIIGGCHLPHPHRVPALRTHQPGRLAGCPRQGRRSRSRVYPFSTRAFISAYAVSMSSRSAASFVAVSTLSFT